MTTATMISTSPHTDDEILESVRREFKWEPKITSGDIAIAVKQGVVTLSGFASSFWEKRTAEAVAKRVYGVRGVANDIQVKIPFTRTDPDIARDAVQKIANDVSIPSEKIKVVVKDGWVTLEGEVDWQYQRASVESTVKKLRGVTGISNQIKIRLVPSALDVKNKIEEALRRSAELDARRVSVEVHGNSVSLYGSVRSWAEREEAERAAAAAPGAVQVNNYIDVTP